MQDVRPVELLRHEDVSILYLRCTFGILKESYKRGASFNSLFEMPERFIRELCLPCDEEVSILYLRCEAN